MESFNPTVQGPPQGVWKRRPVETVSPTVILTLDRNGNPEMPDPRKRGGFYPYLTSGKLAPSTHRAMLVDVSA